MNKDKSVSNDFDEILDDMDKEKYNRFNISEKIENLKIKLKAQHKILIAAEYNRKCAVYDTGQMTKNRQK